MDSSRRFRWPERSALGIGSLQIFFCRAALQYVTLVRAIIFSIRIELAASAEGIIFCVKEAENMRIESIKQEAGRILNSLSDDATWDDLMEQIYVRQAIEAGIQDSDAGRTIDVKEVRKKFGLPE